MQVALYQQERGSAPAPLREHYHPKIQAPRQEGPSRKGPCPCGSGEKYKRCCGKTA
ncbi:SEC-C metal-binding domain-containing protein [Sorangium cellulosum]|uniref:SEC-C metal-binding domain-containing protein n=1 Tax=Sorangium cellulosum TaxID=56 RepID=UPI00040579BF|nr:SEC-C metal-binding domain-containing protein [Sorangium cellulosum]